MDQIGEHVMLLPVTQTTTIHEIIHVYQYEHDITQMQQVQKDKHVQMIQIHYQEIIHTHEAETEQILVQQVTKNYVE